MRHQPTKLTARLDERFAGRLTCSLSSANLAGCLLLLGALLSDAGSPRRGPSLSNTERRRGGDAVATDIAAAPLLREDSVCLTPLQNSSVLNILIRPCFCSGIVRRAFARNQGNVTQWFTCCLAPGQHSKAFQAA
jgi:hypothetical protein